MIRVNRYLVITLLLSAGLASFGFAELVELDSSEFTNTYDGDQIWNGNEYVNDWSSTTEPNPVTPSLSGTVLTATTPGVNGFIEQDSGTSDFETQIGAGAWTVEVRLGLTAGDGVNVWVATGPNSSGTVIYIGSNGLGINGNGSESNQGISSLSNVGVNTFRVAYDDVSDKIHLWRNNILISNMILPINIGDPELIVGDCCSGADGVTVDEFDVYYVRYDTTGAFAPVSEVVVISDQTFSPGAWSTTIYNVSGGATSSSSQDIKGGNPDEFRLMTHQLPSQSNIGVFHAFQFETYDPVVSGAIQSIDYSEDQIEFLPPFSGAAIGSFPSLRQDGIIYFGPNLTYTNLIWQTAALSGLIASDFSSSGLNPDFGATGGVIEFGYSRSNSNNGANPYSTAHGIDNWSFSITPSSLLGDVNLDGVVNLLDVAPFVDRISTGTFQEEADINQDGAVNLLDVGPFVVLLSGG